MMLRLNFKRVGDAALFFHFSTFFSEIHKMSREAFRDVLINFPFVVNIVAINLMKVENPMGVNPPKPHF